jgi:Glu-tRNA(Gln) amidotransferase subunit E-like FAD-binding protein
MAAITVQVNPEVAKAYQEINPSRRKKLEMLFSIMLQQELDKRSLLQIMDDIASKAQERGLTPEILESILADEN